MKTFFLASILILSAISYAAKPTKCELCDKVVKFTKDYEEDETTTYEKYSDFLETVKLSSDKKLAAQELDSLLPATALILKSDVRGELPDYLVDIEDEHPKQFAEALKKLPADKQELLKKEMKESRDFIKEGEEGPTTSKLPENKQAE